MSAINTLASSSLLRAIEDAAFQAHRQGYTSVGNVLQTALAMYCDANGCETMRGIVIPPSWPACEHLNTKTAPPSPDHDECGEFPLSEPFDHEGLRATV